MTRRQALAVVISMYAIAATIADRPWFGVSAAFAIAMVCVLLDRGAKR